MGLAKGMGKRILAASPPQPRSCLTAVRSLFYAIRPKNGPESF